mmetsp:Transcript_36537/g.77765  ORF Transcript_36537/g.77765 Transcript_36537/m.77765 type:complete len:215 (-) Transcript_36537:676-1320(-)
MQLLLELLLSDPRSVEANRHTTGDRELDYRRGQESLGIVNSEGGLLGPLVPQDQAEVTAVVVAEDAASGRRINFARWAEDHLAADHVLGKTDGTGELAFLEVPFEDANKVVFGLTIAGLLHGGVAVPDTHTETVVTNAREFGLVLLGPWNLLDPHTLLRQVDDDTAHLEGAIIPQDAYFCVRIILPIVGQWRPQHDLVALVVSIERVHDVSSFL